MLGQEKKFIANIHPHSDVVWVDRGQMNYISIIDNEFVYKFPKNSENFRLLEKEYATYLLLENSISLNIPRAIELNREHEYLKLSYVEGRVLTIQEATSLTLEQKKSLADELTRFIKEMNSPQLKKGFDKIFETDTNDFYYVENWLKKIAHFCEGRDDALCLKYLDLYEQFSNRLPYGFCVGEFVAQKDLHEDNMLFDEDTHLVGLIDFAEVRYTSIYSELRTVIRFGVDVVEIILDNLSSLANGAKASDILFFAKVYEKAIIVQDKYLKKEIDWRVKQAEYYVAKLEEMK